MKIYHMPLLSVSFSINARLKELIITIIAFLISFILLIRSILIGSKMGKTVGMVLYLISTIVFAVFIGLSIKLNAEIDSIAVSVERKCIENQFKRTLPLANIPKFLNQPNPGTVLGLNNEVGIKEEVKNETKEVDKEASTLVENKGKIIGDIDSKIYHVPGSIYYEREMQKTSNNVYFNTVEEAERAGYRAPKS